MKTINHNCRFNGNTVTNEDGSKVTTYDHEVLVEINQPETLAEAKEFFGEALLLFLVNENHKSKVTSKVGKLIKDNIDKPTIRTQLINWKPEIPRSRMSVVDRTATSIEKLSDVEKLELAEILAKSGVELNLSTVAEKKDKK